jgi:DNA-binding MarR family transcriptional regulator
MTDELEAPQLKEPRSLLDLVNYQMHLIQSFSASSVTRMCEGEFGITRREWRFIALLAAVGPMAPSDLALQSSLDRSRTSKALMPLLAKGLIERRSHAGDRRRATVSLTQPGRALYDRLFPRVVEVNAALLGTLSDEDIATLARLLTALKRRAVEIVDSKLVAAIADRRHGGSLRRWEGRVNPAGGSGRTGAD